MKSLQQHFATQLEKLIQPATERLVVGYSGGIDSTVLLYLLEQFVKGYPKIELLAVHVNHGLQKEADSWQQHCFKQCQQLSIKFQTMQCAKLKSSGHGLEKAARDARFTAFKSLLKENDRLCLAHHANDQTETVLFRLMRGTGVHGLSGIKEKQSIGGVTVIRPLLNLKKNQLMEFAIENDLCWIEDTSNSQNEFDRNFLRNQLLPVIEKRWPEIHSRISQSTQLFHEQHALLESIAEADASSVIAEDGYLKLENFRRLEKKRAANFLSWWFRKFCGYSLGRQRILTICNELENIKRDASFKQQCGNQTLIQSSSRVFLLPHDFFTEDRIAKDIKTLASDEHHYSDKELLLRLGKYCYLKILASSETRLKEFINKGYSIQFGVEKKLLRLESKEKSITTKNLFQQSKTPSWLKLHWPILMHQKSTVSILGFGIEEEFSVEMKGLEFSCLFDWGQGRHFKIPNKIF